MAPAARWYFDADTIGLGKALMAVRNDVTFPGDSGERPGRASRWLPKCPVTSTDTPDAEWIETVTDHGMVIVTRDHRIQSRLSERAAVLSCGARMFAIAQAGQLTTWGLLEVVVARWRDMEALAAEKPGPWICTITRGAAPRQVIPAPVDGSPPK